MDGIKYALQRAINSKSSCLVIHFNSMNSQRKLAENNKIN